jgi:hypothetical protein
MPKDRGSPWLVIAVMVGSFVIAGTLSVSILLLWQLRHPGHAPGGSPPPLPPPRIQVTDYGSGGTLTMTIGSGMGFPGGSFEDRGRRLMARRFSPPTPLLRSVGVVQPTVILGAGPLSVKGRKAYYQALLHELPRPGGAARLLSTTMLVDCPERGATGAVVLSLRVPANRPVGAGADLRGTPADPQFLADELELSSAQLCTFR